ncbi:MAG TPA: hypothetical protein VGQ45_03880 [Gaiellales bacterium]|jgi:hypothetical protein|nr:hypothetical protein [Gaiellales bacterium]
MPRQWVIEEQARRRRIAEANPKDVAAQWGALWFEIAVALHIPSALDGLQRLLDRRRR